MKRLFTVLFAVALIAAMAATPVSAAKYVGGKVSVITEPEAFSSADVAYYIGDSAVSADNMVWVENGYDGKALKLSGNGEFLRLDHLTARVPALTFSAWVNWQGGESGQRLVTIARSTQNYLTVSPYMYNESMHKTNGFVNGVYVRHQFGGTGGKSVNMFNPTTADVTYALPRNEWHHVALTTDGRTVKLYIDGVRWFEEQVLTSLAEAQPHSLDIGTGEWGDPTLNALLDNVELYNSALSETAIQRLANRQAGEAYLPTKPAEPTTTVAPTTATETTTTRQTLSKTVFGVPMWGIYIILGVVALYVVTTVIVNVRREKGDGRK